MFKMRRLFYLTLFILPFYGCEKKGYHEVEITTYSENGKLCVLCYTDANGYESKGIPSGNHTEKITFSEENMTSVSFVNEDINSFDSLYIKVSHKDKDVVYCKRFNNTNYPCVTVSLESLIH
jgi:hypothetical protein